MIFLILFPCLWFSSTTWCFTACQNWDWWGRSSASERGSTSPAWRCTTVRPSPTFRLFSLCLTHFFGWIKLSPSLLTSGAGVCEAEPAAHVCHHWQAALAGAASQVETSEMRLAVICLPQDKKSERHASKSEFTHKKDKRVHRHINNRSSTTVNPTKINISRCPIPLRSSEILHNKPAKRKTSENHE